MAESVVTVAYDNGVNLFDTAEVYASGRYSKISLIYMGVVESGRGSEWWSGRDRKLWSGRNRK